MNFKNKTTSVQALQHNKVGNIMINTLKAVK